MREEEPGCFLFSFCGVYAERLNSDRDGRWEMRGKALGVLKFFRRRKTAISR